MISESQYLISIDLGSNSFHMAVAEVGPDGFRICEKRKDRVQLAAGLDEHNHLRRVAIGKGLVCLAEFGDVIHKYPGARVSAVATQALRQAVNATAFTNPARKLLGVPVRIISGKEEAILVYQGVWDTAPGTQDERRLVIDIGGGSTEIILGEGDRPQMLDSIAMGCVSYTRRFFADGHMSSKQFYGASQAAEAAVSGFALRAGKNAARDMVIGSSGTLKALSSTLQAMGYEDGRITLERLRRLRKAMCKVKRVSRLDWNIRSDRKAVLPAGLAILLGLFERLNIEEMVYVDGALREGLLQRMHQQLLSERKSAS
jgi:exopolyphosphatase/guanosine-5'-triphosphate,3'-diphosphate pyrophosphatase